MEGISDDELRLALSRYMDAVPPVTESTRATLVAKLKKCMSNGFEATQEDTQESDINNSVETPEIRPTENGRQSPKYETAFLETSLSTKEVSSSFMNGLPVQEQSSPVMEYVSRLPSYRRRSVHPDRPGIDNPYSDLGWLPPILSPPTKSRVQFPHKQSDLQSTKAYNNSNIMKSVLYVSIGLISVVFEFCYSSASKLTNALYIRKPSIRLCLCLIFIGLLLLGLTKILYGDPFYQNPVEDLHNFIQYSFTK
ncbi:unnamed protein product [Heterobilharzia americana]|nr:unnamed protein product [Heterobilharzia americana]